MSEEGEISRSTCVDTLVIAIDVAFSIFDPQLNIFLTATSDVPQVAEMRPNILIDDVVKATFRQLALPMGYRKHIFTKTAVFCLSSGILTRNKMLVCPLSEYHHLSVGIRSANSSSKSTSRCQYSRVADCGVQEARQVGAADQVKSVTRRVKRFSDYFGSRSVLDKRNFIVLF